MSVETLPIPEHFDPGKIGEVWRVPYGDRARDARRWAQQHQISRSCEDKVRVGLLLIDVQNTFCIPGFELFVAGRSGNGAVDDNRRLCGFIYRHLHILTDVIPTMDTHTAMQIFHPVFWINDSGEHPAPMSTLNLGDIESGTWRINPDVLPNLPTAIDPEAYAFHYVRELTRDSKYPLTIWPYHAMLGGISHALVSAVEEACFFHSIARYSPTEYEMKGNNPLTENYSVLQPEVLTNANGEAIAQRNVKLADRLLNFDLLLVAGQAKSHCVAWTLNDLCDEIRSRDRKLAQKVYLLEDCTSAVVVPGQVDFTELADETFAKCAELGMHRVRSTDAIETWDGIPTKLR
ncbi:isochorismatase [Leptolyngbya valderiana BDU 20041]|nr:isochorismatase [Leptolyngbya valderiana BDU 20041]PPT08981.1 Nicotinamidase [Geitlerinema sp. FC II]